MLSCRCTSESFNNLRERGQHVRTLPLWDHGHSNMTSYKLIPAWAFPYCPLKKKARMRISNDSELPFSTSPSSRSGRCSIQKKGDSISPLHASSMSNTKQLSFQVVNRLLQIVPLTIVFPLNIGVKLLLLDAIPVENTQRLAFRWLLAQAI